MIYKLEAGVRYSAYARGPQFDSLELYHYSSTHIILLQMLTAWDRVQGKFSVYILFDTSHFYHQYSGTSK